MRSSRLVLAGLVAGSLVLLPAAGAAAAPATIPNGDFEADAVGATTITGWTTMNQLIDLGVTRIAGCVSQDTSSYDTLRDYADMAEGELGEVTVDANGIVLDPSDQSQIWVGVSGQRVHPDSVSSGDQPVRYGTFTYEDETYEDFYFSVGGSTIPWFGSQILDGGTWAIAYFMMQVVQPMFSEVPDPAVRADDVPPADDGDWWDEEPEFTTTVTDEWYSYDPDTEDGEYVPLGGKALKLTSYLSADGYGYVAHGPAVYSDVFTVSGPRTISLDWMAAAVEDDYHVLGYVLNTATCAQTEVLDATGLAAPWTTASVTITQPGDYRFVFVAGSYDYSWGGIAGAELLIDNIRSKPVVQGTGLALDLDLDLGMPVSGATVVLTGGGLKPGSSWTAVLRSDPVELATGLTDANGDFYQTALLPSNVAPGPHTVTLAGVRPDGTPITTVAYITVAADGTLAYYSLTAPEGTDSGTGPALAATGFDGAGLWIGALAALLAGAGLLAARGLRRRQA